MQRTQHYLSVQGTVA